MPGAELWWLPALSPYILTTALQDRPGHYLHHMGAETGTQGIVIMSQDTQL